MDLGLSICLIPWKVNIRMRNMNSAGNTCFLQVVIPNGQVDGVLVEGDGQLFGDRMKSLFLAKVLDEASGKVGLNTTLQTRLDDSGSFLIEDVPEGRYYLVVFCNRRGVFLGFILDDGGLFTFTMPEGGGINLGKVNALEIGAPPPRMS